MAISISKIVGLLGKFGSQDRESVISEFRNNRGVRRQSFRTPLTATPTVTFSETEPANTGVETYSYNRTSGYVNPWFSYRGVIPAQQSLVAPGYDHVSAGLTPLSTVGFGRSVVEFIVFGEWTLPYQRSQNGSLRVFEEIGGQWVETAATMAGIAGTATAGASGSITLNSASSATGFATASAASAVADTYNRHWVYILSGTGAGQFRQITDYSAARVASVSPNWTTPPDNTSVYVVTPHRCTWNNSVADATYNYINFQYGGEFAPRKIRVEMDTFYFQGILLPNDDTPVMPLPRQSGADCFWVGTSMSAGTGAGSSLYSLSAVACAELGWERWNLAIGGTGYLNRNSGNTSLTFRERLVPPTNAWFVSTKSKGGDPTAGTFTLSQNGTTTAAIAYNAAVAAVQSALDTAFGAGMFIVAGATYNYWIIGLGTNASLSATMTIDGSGLTLGTSGTATSTRYFGELAPNIATNGRGAVIVIEGGVNDTTATSGTYTAAALEAEATTLFGQLKALYPEAVIIAVGNIYLAGANTTAVTDANTAIYNAAASTLTRINGRVPFVDLVGTTPPAVSGTGNIATTAGNGTLDVITFTDDIHPSPDGHIALGCYIAAEISELIEGG